METGKIYIIILSIAASVLKRFSVLKNEIADQSFSDGERTVALY